MDATQNHVSKAQLCQQCGHKRILASGFHFCPYCGARYCDLTHITLDPNGAIGAQPYTLETVPGESVLLPAVDVFKRDDFFAVGWNTAPDGSGISCAAGTSVQALTIDTTMYVEWKSAKPNGGANKHTVECAVCQFIYDPGAYDSCPVCEYAQVNKAPSMNRYKHYGVEYSLPKSWNLLVREDDAWEYYWYNDDQQDDVGFAVQFSQTQKNNSGKESQAKWLEEYTLQQLSKIDGGTLLQGKPVSLNTEIGYRAVYVVDDPTDQKTRWQMLSLFNRGELVVFKGWCPEASVSQNWPLIKIAFDGIEFY